LIFTHTKIYSHLYRLMEIFHSLMMNNIEIKFAWIFRLFEFSEKLLLNSIYHKIEIS
jgi:hypothetical protein